MTEFVEIPLERLKQLEELEKSLPQKIEQAILEHKRNNLKRLHEKDKSDPKAVNIRVRRYAEKHKDEINAKRREKRRLKKLEELKKSLPVQEIEEPKHILDPSKRSITVRVTRVDPPPVPVNVRDVTVRFDA